MDSFLINQMELLKLSLIGTFIILLPACSNPIIKQGNAQLESFKDFEIVLPLEVKNKYVRNDKGIAYTSFNAPTNDYKSNDIAVIIFPPESSNENNVISSYYTCDLAGIINPKILTKEKNIQIIVGKIPDPPCEVDVCDFTKYGYSQYKGRYVLCSEHEDKTIRVEVNQVTDNPQLAEEIFSTFRWTE